MRQLISDDKGNDYVGCSGDATSAPSFGAWPPCPLLPANCSIISTEENTSFASIGPLPFDIDTVLTLPSPTARRLFDRSSAPPESDEATNARRKEVIATASDNGEDKKSEGASCGGHALLACGAAEAEQRRAAAEAEVSAGERLLALEANGAWPPLKAYLFKACITNCHRSQTLGSVSQGAQQGQEEEKKNRFFQRRHHCCCHHRHCLGRCLLPPLRFQ